MLAKLEDKLIHSFLQFTFDSIHKVIRCKIPFHKLKISLVHHLFLDEAHFVVQFFIHGCGL